MSIKLDKYTPLMMYLSPASIPQIVAHIQDYLVKHPILSVETIAEIIVQSLQEHPELINGEAIPISADSAQSIKAYIDALPALDTYTKAEINALLLGKQDTLTFDQAPTPGSSNPVTSSGIIAAMSALQSALETQINLKADSASTYTKTQVDTLLTDKADADNVYSKNTMDAKLLEVNTDIDNLEDDLSHQSQQIDNVEAAAAYVEDGTTASRTYTEGQFVLWQGLLYTVKTGGMPQGKTISATYLNPVTGGGLNNLKTYVDDKFIISSASVQNVAYNLTRGTAKKNGSVKSLDLVFTTASTTEIPPKDQYVTIGIIPVEYAPTGENVRMIYYDCDNNGVIIYMYQISIQTNGTIQVYNYRNTRLAMPIHIVYI